MVSSILPVLVCSGAHGAEIGSGSECSSTTCVVMYKPPPAGTKDSVGEVWWQEAHHGQKHKLLNLQVHESADHLIFVSSTKDKSKGALILSYRKEKATQDSSFNEKVSIVVAVSSAPKSIQVDISSTGGTISSLDAGLLANDLSWESIPVPYYSGNVQLCRSRAVFVNYWWDLRRTQANRIDTSTVRYDQSRDGSRGRVSERLVLRLSRNVDDVLPSMEVKPSPYIEQLKGRPVLDIWTENFGAIREGFDQLKDFGISDCVSIIHSWQNAGYDNALPKHYPANPKFGGDHDLGEAIRAGKDDGCYVALHENYIDYYPNYPIFDPAAIVTGPDGKPVTGWKNQYGIQSFQTKPAWMMRNAITQSPEIHRRYATDSAFIDVNSAIAPDTVNDMDATSSKGSIQVWLDAASQLWSFERKTHAGPVFGEGRDHWIYTGMLDGVEAQLGPGGTPEKAGDTLPLFVDFDLRHLHPYQVNQGMGYYERWTPSGSSYLTAQQFDAYRMQEIIFGHTSFLGANYWNNVPYAFVDAHLISPVAKSYGAAAVVSISYQVHGRWVDSSKAVIEGILDRPHVSYENGLEVVANGESKLLKWKGLSLPQFGWVAIGPDVYAYSALCGQAMCEYAQTATSIFANARNQADIANGTASIEPLAASLAKADERSFSITYHWTARKKVTTEGRVFVHFAQRGDALDAAGGTAFQDDHELSSPARDWPVGNDIADGPHKITLPPSIYAGDFTVYVGMVDAATGIRVHLIGDANASGQYAVGEIRVQKDRPISLISGPPGAIHESGAESTSLLDFGTVQTDGMIFLKRQGDEWQLTPFPRTRDFTVLLNRNVFPLPTAIRSNDTTAFSFKPERESNKWWRINLSGARSYSWSATPGPP